MTLSLAQNFALPDDAVTQTIAILARRGAGKTYTAKVLAEEMIERALPVVILDPVGVWWGLRSNAAGTGAGYPVTILGGDHGDIPLEASAGTLVANLVAEEPVAIVLDLSAFNSKAEQRRFTTDFAERLYRAKAERRAPLHLMIDEADEFAPQVNRADNARMLGAFETLVRRGRARGIGVTMITQRPAVLNKNVLTQIECLMVMQITSPQDRKALGDWVAGHAEPGEQKMVEDSLAGLKQGEGWVWSPAWLEESLQRIKVRKARTFDSSATPKPGETRREAKVLARVDLDRLKEGMERVVVEAEKNDPRKLRARVRELEKELAKRPTETVTETIEVPVEVPVLDDETIERLRTLVAPVSALLEEISGRVGSMALRRPEPRQRPAKAPQRREAAAPPSARVVPPEERELNPLGKAERSILTVLALFPEGRTFRQIAMMTGYSPTASTIGVALSKLRRLGYVGAGNNPARATQEGIDALGPVEPLPSGPELLAFWKSHHLGKAEKAILDLLIAAYPEPLTHDEVCTATGYSPDASTVGVAMSKLRRLELADGWRAADDFMEAIE